MNVPTNSTLPAFAALEMLCLEMHAQMTFDDTAFSFTRFAAQMVDANMILINTDLRDYEMALTDALTAHPQRTISVPMVQTIYRNLFVLQRMAKMGGAS